MYSVSVSHQRVALIGGTIYLVFFLLIGADVVRGRQAKDAGQAEVVRALLAQMNRECFSDDAAARFTLFRPSPFAQERLVAWYRYRKGSDDLVSQALRSRVSYKKDEGFTGAAWSRPGQLVCAILPAFSSREEFERHYVEELNVSPDTVKSISDTMLNVRSILTYGFQGSEGKFLGVLSIDLVSPIDATPPDNFLEIRGKYLYADVISHNLRSLTAVLECFSKAQL
jgi:hypothetical protein